MAVIFTTVASIRDEAIDIRSFELLSADDAPLPEFSPGSHIDVFIGDGLIRQYSLWNSPSDRFYRIAVKKEVASRGGSKSMHEKIRVGDVLKISPPRNNFPLKKDDGPILLIAGGIGITPLLSMAHDLLESDRQFALHYFTRSVEHTAFHERLSMSPFLGKVTFHHEGNIDQVKASLHNLLKHRATDAQLYLCGPRPFMDTVESVAAASWPSQALHREYFGAAPNVISEFEKDFVVSLARSGGKYPVTSGKSIVQVLAEQGVEIPTSCEQGICGTCLTGVLAGTPEHRDAYMSDAEKAKGDQICPCVSRALSAELVLDL